MQQLAQFGSKTQLTIQWLSQLFLALECDMWLGTRNSNWNRLIDELRCTSGPTTTGGEPNNSVAVHHHLVVHDMINKQELGDLRRLTSLQCCIRSCPVTPTY